MHRFALFSVAATAAGSMSLSALERAVSQLNTHDQIMWPVHPEQEWDWESSRSLSRSIARRSQQQDQEYQTGYMRQADFQQLPARPMTPHAASNIGRSAFMSWEARAIEDLCRDEDWDGLRLLGETSGVSQSAKNRVNNILEVSDVSGWAVDPLELHC